MFCLVTEINSTMGNMFLLKIKLDVSLDKVVGNIKCVAIFMIQDRVNVIL